MSKTHWKKLVNPDYLGAYSIPDGEDLVVTILSVSAQKVKGADGKEETCSVATLKNQKPWILNMTNQKTIQKLHGPYIEDWVGKQVVLYATTTKIAREEVECIRVRPKVVAQTKQPITEARFKNALGAVKAGTYDADKIRKQFDLTAEQERELQEIGNAEPASV